MGRGLIHQTRLGSNEFDPYKKISKYIQNFYYPFSLKKRVIEYTNQGG